MGLLQAAAQVAGRGVSVLFCVYDAPLAGPLGPLHQVDFPFAMACVLTPQPAPGTRGTLLLRHHATPGVAEPSPWDALGLANPAARSLPVLAALAAGRATTIVQPLLDEGHVEIGVTPC